MLDLSQHILDIAENSARAAARRIEIRIIRDTAADALRLEIVDDGEGMDEDMCRRAMSPFATSRTERRVGLGLALLAQATRETGGECRLESSPGQGTRVTAVFRQSHIDCKPLGDLGETLLTLAVGNPDIQFLLHVQHADHCSHFDTRDLDAALGAGSRSTPAGIKTLRGRIGEVLEALLRPDAAGARVSHNEGATDVCSRTE